MFDGFMKSKGNYRHLDDKNHTLNNIITNILQLKIRRNNCYYKRRNLYVYKSKTNNLRFLKNFKNKKLKFQIIYAQ